MQWRKVALSMARVRKKLSAVVLWCTFVALYGGGAVMLVLGFYLACCDWWSALQHHANRLAIGTKTTEIFVLALGVILILIVPVFERQFVGRSVTWKMGPTSESKSKTSESGKDCVPIR